MALDWFSGFDHLATADLTTGVSARFTAISGATVSSSAARNGTNGLRITGSGNYAQRSGLSNAATRILGFACKFDSVTSDPGRVFAALGDGDPTSASFVQVGLALSGSGKLQVFRGRQIGANSSGTQLGSDSTNGLTSNTFYYIELVVTVNNSTGVVEVWVNGTKTGWIDLTAQNTRNTANSQANSFGFGGRNGSTANDFDDVYCVSGTGGTSTARLGDVKAIAKVASAGNGTNTGLTPSTGSDHGALVDDAAPNGDTDYNSAAASGVLDTYNFAAIGTTGQIYGLNIHNYVKKTDAGTCDAQPVARIGSTDYLGTQVPVSQTYGYLTELYENSPETTAPWTAGEIDGAEFGVKRAA
jgi:hypothetical protein